MTTMPFVVGDIRTDIKRQDYKVGQVEISYNVETIQTTALLK